MTTSTASNPVDRLLQVFLQTEYVVKCEPRVLIACIGKPQPAIDELAAHRPWAIITACNPQARKLEATSNRERHLALLAAVEQAGLDHFDTVNRDPSGRWPDELGLLLCGASDRTVIALARRFGQLALVRGTPGEPVELWLTAGAWPAELPEHVREVAR